MMDVNKRETIITQGTFVPLVWVASIVVAIIGGMAWLTTIYIQTTANAETINGIQKSIDYDAARNTRMWEAIRGNEKRLARIEGKLDILLMRNKEVSK